MALYNRSAKYDGWFFTLRTAKQRDWEQYQQWRPFDVMGVY